MWVCCTFCSVPYSGIQLLDGNGGLEEISFIRAPYDKLCSTIQLHVYKLCDGYEFSNSPGFTAL